MKVLGIISTATLFLVLGTAVPALAQDDHHDEGAKPAQHEEQAKPAKQQHQAKPAKQEEQAKPARQEQAKANNQEPKQETKSAKQEPQSKAAHEQQAKPVKQQRQAKPEQRQEQAKATKPETRTKPVSQEERGNTGGNGHVQRTSAEMQRQRSQPELRLSARGEGRIPDDRFRSNFGRGHEFRIGTPRLVGGYSRFQYGGFWFGFVDPWPVGWYYTDDVYVDFIDGGYYLCNPSYPGAQIAISVVL